MFLESDFTLKNKVDWDTFSYAVQSTRKYPSNHLTLYHPRQQFSQVLNTKAADPIYSVWFAREARTFGFCCKDFCVHIFDEHDLSTEILVLRGHQSLPLSLVSIRPPIIDFVEVKLEPHTGGFNYLTSGADRKIIVWN